MLSSCSSAGRVAAGIASDICCAVLRLHSADLESLTGLEPICGLPSRQVQANCASRLRGRHNGTRRFRLEKDVGIDAVHSIATMARPPSGVLKHSRTTCLCGCSHECSAPRPSA